MSEKIVAICQPNFLPWLGYFEMAERADVFVMLDDVQYVRREWMNRNRIACPSEQGWQWIVVQLEKHARCTAINEVKPVRDGLWQQKVFKQLEYAYGKAPFFDQYYPSLQVLLSQPWENLAQLNIATIEWAYAALNMPLNLLRSSELGISGRKDTRLLAICEHFGASRYLANDGSKPYIDPEKFTKHGINFDFQSYRPPAYTVGQGRFCPALSIIDLLFWHGPRALGILLQGRFSADAEV